MANRIGEHFHQPAGIPAATLCSGVLTAWALAFFGLPKPDDRALILMFGAFTALPAAAYLLYRVARPFSGAQAIPPRGCALCGERTATSPVRYLQLTGAVVLMVTRELPVHTCRRCSRDVFLRATLHTLVLGWWGVFAFLCVPGFVLNNLLFLARSHVLGSSSGHARRLLDDRREYARNLLATKDEATVVDVLSRDTGLAPDAVRAYLSALGPASEP